MKGKVSSKGQITIPRAIRRELGILEGTKLEFHAENGRLIARKKLDEDPILRWRGRGKLPGYSSVDRYLEGLRCAHGSG